MSRSFKRYKTGREVILALKTYGPLTKRSLCFVTAFSKEKVRATLRRLISDGFVQEISYKYEERFGIYYYIDPRIDRRFALAEELNCKADDLKFEHLRHIELPHEQRVARLQHELSRMFPQVTLLRDYQLDKYHFSERVFPAVDAERRLYPDLLLHFVDKGREHGECFIAFEIEESLKSKQRVVEKLSRYATESLLDGVVYISTMADTIESVSRSYSKKVMQENLRIKHYGNHFLLFQGVNPKADSLPEKAYNVLGQNVSLKLWILSLMTTENTGRRDALFQNGEHKAAAKEERT